MCLSLHVFVVIIINNQIDLQYWQRRKLLREILSKDFFLHASPYWSTDPEKIPQRMPQSWYRESFQRNNIFNVNYWPFETLIPLQATFRGSCQSFRQTHWHTDCCDRWGWGWLLRSGVAPSSPATSLTGDTGQDWELTLLGKLKCQSRPSWPLLLAIFLSVTWRCHTYNDNDNDNGLKFYRGEQ